MNYVILFDLGSRIAAIVESIFHRRKRKKIRKANTLLICDFDAKQKQR